MFDRTDYSSSPAKSSAPLGPGALTLLFLPVLVASLLLTPACLSPAARAKEELARRGLEISEAAFLEHVKSGDLETVRLYLAAGISPDAASGGYTAILEAARRGHEEIALELVEAGALLDVRDPHGVTPLMFSLITGSGAAAAAIMEKGADVNALDVDGRTALIEALTTENDIPAEVIGSLLRRGADVNVRTAGGTTPLMIAVHYDPAVVRMLVDEGADVNARDESGASVLRMAKGNPENVKILEEAGALE